MNTTKKFTEIICAIGILTMAACTGQSSEQDAASLYAESMEIHDQIMPLMDELFTLRQKLTMKLDSLKADSTSNEALIRDTRNGIDALARADKEMMDWMHNIKDVPGSGAASDHHRGDHATSTETLPEEEVLRIQQQQKDIIAKVKTDIEQSITIAKALLGQQ